MLGFNILLPLILLYFTYEQVATFVKKTGFNTEMEIWEKKPSPSLDTLLEKSKFFY
jgi:hypothetical protein